MSDGNWRVLKFVTEQLQHHEEVVEDCTCVYDNEDCWYNLSDKEKHKDRIEFLIGKLQKELEETQ